ncbi:MAG: hypothetical protein FJ190_13305 [Gammaproteobacteria bacterium]|nr:hypothetical protein [Gammaproteobacteria bacterium]
MEVQMLKLTREYYSLYEAAILIAGKSFNYGEGEKVIKDFVHKAAKGEITLILLVAGRLIGERYDKNGENIPAKIPFGERGYKLGSKRQKIMDAYVYIGQDTMMRYEAAKTTTNYISITNAYAADGSGDTWLLSDSYYDEDGRKQQNLALNQNTIYIFSKDIEAYYLEQQVATEGLVWGVNQH